MNVNLDKFCIPRPRLAAGPPGDQGGLQLRPAASDSFNYEEEHLLPALDGGAFAASISDAAASEQLDASHVALVEAHSDGNPTKRAK